MKIVYNAGYGGFSLSEAAAALYWERKGLPVPVYGGDRNMPRDDIVLVHIIEELGVDANGIFANLKIVDVPTGARWRIDEYDGYERVRSAAPIHRWNIAT